MQAICRTEWLRNYSQVALATRFVRRARKFRDADSWGCPACSSDGRPLSIATSVRRPKRPSSVASPPRAWNLAELTIGEDAHVGIGNGEQLELTARDVARTGDVAGAERLAFAHIENHCV